MPLLRLLDVGQEETSLGLPSDFNPARMRIERAGSNYLLGGTFITEDKKKGRELAATKSP